MIKFNKSAYGQTLRVNIGQDISAATAFALTLQPEVGDKLELTPTLGTANVDVGDETFTANEYVEYITTSGLFDFTGRWRAKATATLATSIVSSDYRFFRVTE